MQTIRSFYSDDQGKWFRTIIVYTTTADQKNMTISSANDKFYMWYHDTIS